MENNYSGIIISSFNIDNFAAFLNNIAAGRKIQARGVQYGQVVQALMDEKLWADKPDYAVIWTLPEAVSETFGKLTNYTIVDIEDIFREIDRFCKPIIDIAKAVKKAVFIPTWVIPGSYQWLGMLEMKTNVGAHNVLMQMNLRMAKNFDNEPNVYVMNTQKWIECAGEKKSFNPKMWYLGKIAFGNEVFKEAVKDVVSALDGISGGARKLVILDLDETLWGGIVGDAGWNNIILGGHDPIGEALVDFQKALKSLTNKGILLGIVSKNEESVAREAIEKHPEMVLRLKDFSGWKINWNNKVDNIRALTDELNIGLQSVVFIDDNPVERAQVKDLLPDVLVPDWPQDKLLYKKTLCELDCFNSPIFSMEDAGRTTMYAEQRQRKEAKTENANIEEWLKTLETVAIADEITGANKDRIIQLLNKTNQMNLSTRRMTENELSAWLSEGRRKLWSFRVSDKFGDSGLTGLVSLEIKNDNTGQIVDFVLSCRVMGRKIEEAMVCFVLERAREAGVDRIFAKYIPTAKNKPCLEFLEKNSKMGKAAGDVFEINTEEKYESPECIKIIRASNETK